MKQNVEFESQEDSSTKIYITEGKELESAPSTCLFKQQLPSHNIFHSNKKRVSFPATAIIITLCNNILRFAINWRHY